jgi:hypothetical protein
MLDSQLQTIIQSTLMAGLAARGVTAKVVQNNQPRQFSAPSGPTIYHTLSSPRRKYGWAKNRDILNEDGQTFTRTTTQVMHTRFQIAAVSPISPATPNGLTSGDLSSIAASILTFEDAIESYVAQDCNVFRVSDLPGIWFEDNNAQNVLWSSFDIIFTHDDVYTSTTGTITDFVSGIYRV